MKTSQMKKRNLLIVSEAIVIVLQLLALIMVWLKYDAVNVVFYHVLVYFTMQNLFSQKPHHICASLWSIMTIFVIGWFFGIVAVTIYWAMYCLKVKNSPRSNIPQPQPQPRGTTAQNPGVIKRYGRIPFVRIPLPWLKYTLDLELSVLTRDCLFPEKRDKDNPKRDFLGKDDDLLLNQVFDWSFSTKLWRTLAGTSCFEFQSKKIGKSGDKKTHWHFVPASMIKPLRATLIKVNNKTK